MVAGKANKADKGKFARDTLVHQRDEHTWTANFSEDWNIGQVPNSGYTLSIGAKVLAEALPHPDPMTITAYYVARTEPGPVQCEVDILRVGKGSSTGMVRMVQNGETKIQVIGSYTNFDKVSGEHLSNIKIPDMPTFEQCIDTPVRPNIQLRKQLIQRMTETNVRALEGEVDASASWMGWTAFADGSDIDLFALLMFADAMPPPIFSLYDSRGWVPTLDLSVQIHRKPEPGLLRCAFHSPLMTNGILDEDGVIWDSADNVVALVRQTAKLKIKK